jgi:hypothetical protein
MVLVHGDKGMGLFELFEGLIVLLCLGQAAFAQRVTVLNQGWELLQKTDSAARTEGKWYLAEVPGIVHRFAAKQDNPRSLLPFERSRTAMN